MTKYLYFFAFLLLYLLNSCKSQKDELADSPNYVNQFKNTLDYVFTPQYDFDKNGLMFSDQGAWFAYSIPESASIVGFSGPFLMTQQNGVWSSQSLSQLKIKNQLWKSHKTQSFHSHLEQIFESENLRLTQSLFFLSGHSVEIKSIITNISSDNQNLEYHWTNSPIFAEGLQLIASENQIIIESSKSSAIGSLSFSEEIESCVENHYKTKSQNINLNPGDSCQIQIHQSFIFPEYSLESELKFISKSSLKLSKNTRENEKNIQLKKLIDNKKQAFDDTLYSNVLAKALISLQNNWRIPAGEIKESGLFPSYHYKWFNGFWSWDSWKHAVGLSYYDTFLAEQQIKLMFNFQNENGFVADCVFRDTIIEKHNYRDTKPPLAAWSVAQVYSRNQNKNFIKLMYPKLLKYHYWWYKDRDHDKDGLCEYGSTDGSLIAAKWESGMDNAIRFDQAKMLINASGAYSLNQESVDLNAYLYAEKMYLIELAEVLSKLEDVAKLKTEAEELKIKIQSQFYDEVDGWFYDTSIDGKQFIKGEGSEGWIPLWAETATQDQANSIRTKMMNPLKFFTKVPFQTMSADHPKFNPLKGYWRGPNWLDQAYFGVKGLRNYGFNEDADKATIQIINGAEGLHDKGTSIRENYHPITGEGLNAKNFSWSAAHLIMLLQNE